METISGALSSMEAMPLFVSQKKPHFFRIFFPEHHSSQLKIPVDFEKHINSRKHEIVSLIGPSQSAWSVELVSDDDGMFFRDGWSEFVVDHTLSEKEFLLFTYAGNLHFTVKIFGGNACEKEKALHASPCQDISIIGDSQTLKKSLVNIVEETCEKEKTLDASPCQDITIIGDSQTLKNSLVNIAEEAYVKEKPLNDSACQDITIIGDSQTLKKTLVNIEEDAYLKEKPLNASPCQDITTIGDSQALKKSLVNVVEDLCPPSRDYFPINAETALENPLSEAELGCLVRTPDRCDGERPHAANPSSMPYWSGSRGSDDPKKMDGRNKHMHSESSGRKRGRPRKIDVIKETPRTIDIIKESTQLDISTTKEIVSVSDNEADEMGQELIIKEEPVEFVESLSSLNVPCLHLSDSTGNKEILVDESFNKKSLSSKKRVTTNSSELDTTHSQKRRHSTSSANRHVSVRSRIGILVSNRRPVTPDEVTKAYESARSFASEKPSVLVVMRESHVYRGFYLNLPCTFVRDHLPTYSRKLTLWSPSGEPWEVNYVSHRGYGGLSARWSAFALAHNLEVDDVCVFELFRQHEMRVHIFRVVEEITPLTNVPLSLQA